MSSADLLSRPLSSRSRKALAALSAIALAAAALVLSPGTSNAQIEGTRAYDTLYSTSLIGDVTFAANSLVLNAQTKTFADSDSDASTSNSSTAELDIPAGATVQVAWLHWMAKTKGAGSATHTTQAQAAPTTEADAVAWVKSPTDTAYQVLSTSSDVIRLNKFTDPGSTTDASDDINVWMASADITSLVTSSGSYTVSVPFLNGAEAPEMAGWNMTVVYSLPVGTAGAKLRNITVVDGFDSLVTGENVAFASSAQLQTATGASVNVGIAGLGGDAGMSDYLRVAAGPTAATGSDIVNALNPMPGTTHISSDIFNGTISKNGVNAATRSPGYAPSATPGTPGTGFTAIYDKTGSQYQSPNDFGNDYSSGFDSDTFNVSSVFTAAPTQVSVQFGPSATVDGTGGKPNDTIYPAVAFLTVDLAAPLIKSNVDISDTDTASPNIGVGDKVQVTIKARNIGPENGKSSAVTATLPAALLYIPDSAKVAAGSLNAGSKSDVVSSPSSPVDGYSYDAGSRKITWNLGAAPQHILQANAADGEQTLTFEAYVTEAVRTVNVAPTPEDYDGIIVTVKSEAVSTLDADGSAPSIAFSTGYKPTMDFTTGVAYPGTSRHDLNLTTSNVVMEALTATNGRLRFKALNNGPVNTLATVKWEYNNTEFTPTTAGVTGAACSTAVVSGSASALTCDMIAAVPSLGVSAEITVPLTFLKDRATLQPGKIWVARTGASSPDASDIDAANKYTTNTLYEKTAQGASTWPTIPQAAPFVVNADSYSVGHNLPLTITAANGLLKNDTGAGLSIVSNSSAVMAGETTARGTLAVAADGSFTFTAPTDFKGVLTFTYSVRSTDYPKKADGTDRIEIGTVTLVVADKTESVADTYYTPKATELTVTAAKGIFSNDLGTPFTLTSLTGSDSKSATVAADGSFSLTTSAGVIRGAKADGSFIYTPNATFVGKDVITYAATDSFGSPKSGVLTIEVLDKPALEDDTIEATGGKMNFNPLKNDKGTTLKITAFDKTSKEGGTIVQEIDGTLTFTPKTGYFGTDSFTYTVTDAAGQTAIGTVSVVIPEALAYTGDHVLAPVSAGLLLMVTALLFFMLSSRRMTPAVRKP